MKVRRTRLETLFDTYAKNLALVKQHPFIEMRPDLDDIVICPICLLYFDRNAIANHSITLEHIPPKTLGGKPRTLTCYECNKLYSPLDEHLRQAVSNKPFLEGLPGGSISVSVQMKDGPGFKATVEHVNAVDRTFLIKNNQKISQEHFEKIQQNLERRNAVEMTIRLRTLPKSSQSVNLVRIAYLLLFSTFGYGLIFHPNYIMLRKQLHNPKSEILPNWGLVEVDSQNFNNEFMGVNIIYHPSSICSFLIVFDLKTRSGIVSRHAVILPGPGRPNDSEIISSLQTISDEKSVNIKVYHVGNRSHGEEFAQPLLAYDIWQELNEKSEHTRVS